MTLEEEISAYKKEIIRLNFDLLAMNKRHDELLKMTEVSGNDVIKDIVLGEEKLVSLETVNGNYEYILGGDGRSQPWSQIRSGYICNVTLMPNIYLSNNHRDFIIRYLKNELKVNDVNIL